MQAEDTRKLDALIAASKPAAAAPAARASPTAAEEEEDEEEDEDDDEDEAEQSAPPPPPMSSLRRGPGMASLSLSSARHVSALGHAFARALRLKPLRKHCY